MSAIKKDERPTPESRIMRAMRRDELFGGSPKMSARGPSNFRQRDLTAAVKGLEDAGKSVASVVIEASKIIIVVAQSPGTAVDDLDIELHEFEARHGQG